MVDTVAKIRREMFRTEGKLQAYRRVMDEHLHLLNEVAAGEVNPSDPQMVEAVRVAVKETEQVFRILENIGEQNFKEPFWKTHNGQLLAHGFLWLMKDDLITLKEAACLLWGITPEQFTLENKWRILMNTLTCGRYGDPKLKTYYDPTPKMRYPMRVSRNQVMDFKREQRSKGR